ncbi:MAG: ABC transporter permease [Holophagales bacterium]|nr:ABC transporter permease [Holophagales bacterium]
MPEPGPDAEAGGRSGGAHGPADPHRRGRRDRWWRLLRTPPVIGLGILISAALAAPWLAPYPPELQTDPIGGRLRPPLTRAHAVELPYGEWLIADRVERTERGLRIEQRGRSRELSAAEVRNLTDTGVADRVFFLMGTDAFGRDIWSRWLHGARISLAIAVLSLVLALAVGLGVGALAALGGPILDALLMRMVDGMLAFPALVLLLALAAIYPPDPALLVLFLGFTGWMSISRIARGEILSLRKRDFVLAARGLGMGELRIFGRHILPHMTAPLAVDAAMRIGLLILTEAALSYLGLGIVPPTASWGNMIDDGRQVIAQAWWLITFPAVGLTTTVILFTLLAEHLRRVFDPRSQD